MDLIITHCQATKTSVIVFFSTPVDATPVPTFAVFDPPAAPINGSGTLDSARLSAKFTLSSPLSVGNQILVSVTGIKVGGEEQAPLAVGTVVRSDLTIVNCVATSGLVVVYFSEALNTPASATDPTSPNNPSNYTVSIAGGQTVQPTQANYDTAIKATFLQFAPNQLQAGQLVTVTVNNVTASGSGIPIGNSGSNTFSTRVRDESNGGGGNRNGRVKEITESVEDAVAYPILTEQVSFPTSVGAAPMAGPVTTGATLGQSAAKAVTDVLGWKVNASDPKGFVGALTQAFTLTEIEGHVEATWNPRSYAVQTDLGGGITGAQASLYMRAKDALDKSLPLLDGLYPLDPDADPEYVKALREMARSQMSAIVTELGTVGGPSVLRVNTYFGILLGTPQPISFQPGVTVPVFDPDKIAGTLGTVRDTYGIFFQNNPFSNSVEDEQDITNFRVISDYMTSLLQSWISNGQFFVLGSPGQPAFFGTQLVLISRQFSVIAETVNEVRFALDSVFIGPSEQQTLLLQLANFPAIFLADMLHEIEGFVTEEGPGLLQTGGRISVANNILPVMQSLQGMITEARRPVNIRSLPDGFRTIRVQRALDDLRDQLSELISLVQPVTQQVPPPVQEPEEAFAVLGVSPNFVDLVLLSGRTIPVTVIGAAFRPGATCSFTPTPGQTSPPPISVIGLPTFLSSNLLVAQVRLGSVTQRLTFTYDVGVTNPDGTRATPLLRGLTAN